MLRIQTDIYGGVTVSSADNRDITPEELGGILKESFDQWKGSAVRSVWLKIDLKHSDWVPVCAKLGFEFHHARKDTVVMTKWIEEGTPASLPLYPFTSVGVGGVILSDDDMILLMRERTGAFKGWKFPGGLADPGEDLFDTVCREAQEETGIRCSPVSVLAFRHMHGFKFKECSDLYFVCLLRPDGGEATTPKPCPRETADCKWFTREELNSFATNEFSPLSRWVLSKYESYKATRIQILPEIVQSHSGRWKMYSVAKS